MRHNHLYTACHIYINFNDKNENTVLQLMKQKIWRVKYDSGSCENQSESKSSSCQRQDWQVLGLLSQVNGKVEITGPAILD
jgi:hypothetical protein